MPNEQIKEKLLKVDFTVIMSGKKSKRVDGLYKPDTREIILHNKNFSGDHELMYTAIHELAHHVQFSKAVKPITSRTHTPLFWNIFHTLLKKAEELGVYENVFETVDEFRKLTETIRSGFLEKNGTIMKEFGRILIEAKELCDKYHASFSDYIERTLKLPKSSAETIMKTYAYNINPEVGFDNMKTIAGIKDEDKRREVESAILEGASPYMVKMNYLTEEKDHATPVDALKQEKKSIEKKIRSLKTKLAMIQKQIDEIERE
jgi:hypothetical protein